MEQKIYIMCYCTLTYDDNLILVMLFIEISCIIVFFTNIESVIYWYFLSQFFKAVKESHKLQFSILIDANIQRHQIHIT